EFQILPEELDRLDSSRFGLLERDGKKLYRYRAKDYRIYFEKSPEGITVHRVLHKNTLRDFLFRTKLPTGEDEQLRERREFWKLIEQGERTRRKMRSPSWRRMRNFAGANFRFVRARFTVRMRRMRLCH